MSEGLILIFVLYIPLYYLSHYEKIKNHHRKASV